MMDCLTCIAQYFICNCAISSALGDTTAHELPMRRDAKCIRVFGLDELFRFFGIRLLLATNWTGVQSVYHSKKCLSTKNCNREL